EYPAEVARPGLWVDEHCFGGQELHAGLLEHVLGAAVGDTLPDVSKESETECPEFEHEFRFGQTTTYGCVLVIHISSLFGLLGFNRKEGRLLRSSYCGSGAGVAGAGRKRKHVQRTSFLAARSQAD